MAGFQGRPGAPGAQGSQGRKGMAGSNGPKGDRVIYVQFLLDIQYRISHAMKIAFFSVY